MTWSSADGPAFSRWIPVRLASASCSSRRWHEIIISCAVRPCCFVISSTKSSNARWKMTPSRIKWLPRPAFALSVPAVLLLLPAVTHCPNSSAADLAEALPGTDKSCVPVRSVSGLKRQFSPTGLHRCPHLQTCCWPMANHFKL